MFIVGGSTYEESKVRTQNQAQHAHSNTNSVC